MSAASYWTVNININFNEHYKWMQVQDKCESKDLRIYHDSDKMKAKEIYCEIVEYLQSKYGVKG